MARGTLRLFKLLTACVWIGIFLFTIIVCIRLHEMNARLRATERRLVELAPIVLSLEREAEDVRQSVLLLIPQDAGL